LSTSLPGPAPSATEPKQVSFAVRAPNWLGDAVLAIPAVKALTGESRRGRVVVLASASSAQVFSRIPGTLTFNIKTPGSGLAGSARSLIDGSAVLRRLAPVMVFSLTRSLSSAVLCFLGRVPRRVGFRRAAGAWLYTDRVNEPGSSKEHLVDTYCRLVESVGLAVETRTPSIQPSAEDRTNGEDVLRRQGLSQGGFICLFPGARYGPSKRWESSRFALLGDTAAAKFGLDVVILGGREDRQSCEAVAEGMTKTNVNLCGTLDFSALVGTLGLSAAVVANDSGGMHLGAALGVPVVGLFFSTDPEWTGPLSRNSAVIYKRAECSPCFKRDCRRGSVCTRTITVEDVTTELERVLGSGS